MWGPRGTPLFLTATLSHTTSRRPAPAQECGTGPAGRAPPPAPLAPLEARPSGCGQACAPR